MLSQRLGSLFMHDSSVCVHTFTYRYIRVYKKVGNRCGLASLLATRELNKQVLIVYLQVSDSLSYVSWLIPRSDRQYRVNIDTMKVVIKSDREMKRFRSKWEKWNEWRCVPTPPISSRSWRGKLKVRWVCESMFCECSVWIYFISHLLDIVLLLAPSLTITTQDPNAHY